MLRESHKHTKQETRLARLAVGRMGDRAGGMGDIHSGYGYGLSIKLWVALLNEWCDRVARTAYPWAVVRYLII
jgi:hypothetical protein